MSLRVRSWQSTSAACAHDFVALPRGIQRRAQDRHRVLQPLRQLGHAALPVGQAQLVLAHRAAEISHGERCSHVGGELGVLPQRLGHRRAAAAAAWAAAFAPASHLAYGTSGPAGPRAWAGLAMFGFLMPAACRALPIGSKNCTPCCLTSDLKKAMPSISPSPFVDAGGQILVHVVAEHVAVQERAAAVGLHQQLDRRLPSATSLPKILAMMHSISPR